MEAAAKLIAQGGPAGLSTRGLAAEAGTSTMAVYTYFGSMSELVREIVHDGFARLERHFRAVEATEDPVSDMALLGRAYRHNALTNQHVFGVMFGGASLAGFELSEEDRNYGRFVLSSVLDCAARCIESERFRDDDPGLVAHQMWLGVHGTVSLELGAYLVAPYDADRCFESQLVALMVGAGDRLDSASKSVAMSLDRLHTVFDDGELEETGLEDTGLEDTGLEDAALEDAGLEPE
jgi:AcrR family transcriptional regulator